VKKQDDHSVSRRSLFSLFGGAASVAVMTPMKAAPVKAAPDPALVDKWINYYRDLNLGNDPGASHLTPAQRRASDIMERYPYVCLFGGARSGKTTAIVRQICLRAARYGGSRHAILRSKSAHAEAAITSDTLPKVMSLFFNGLRYKHIRPDSVFLFPNDSEIRITGLDDQDSFERVLGGEYDTVFLNQCDQMPNYAAGMMLTRTKRLYCDLNPVDTSHWTYKMFAEKIHPVTGAGLAPEYYAMMSLNPVENRANLSDEYLAELENSTGPYRRRFYEGQWGA
jgi:Terminase large subunit, T4likevirus-type, N-terminal